MRRGRSMKGESLSTTCMGPRTIGVGSAVG
jgi:hypothetical protein